MDYERKLSIVKAKFQAMGNIHSWLAQLKLYCKDDANIQSFVDKTKKLMDDHEYNFGPLEKSDAEVLHIDEFKKRKGHYDW